MVEVGQIVEVRHDLVDHQQYGGVIYLKEMSAFLGKIVVVKKVIANDEFELYSNSLSTPYIFTESMLTDRKFKFKIGDKVKATKGQGEIVDHKLTDSGIDEYLVKGHDGGHDGFGTGILGYRSDKSDCWWYNTSYISLADPDNKPMDVSKQIKVALIGHKDGEYNPRPWLGDLSFMIPQVAEKKIIEEMIEKHPTISLSDIFKTCIKEKSSLHSKRRAYVRSKIRVEA